MNLDIIGKIYNIDNTDPENPVTTELAGWHVNTAWPYPEMESYRVEPATPRRVFSGVDTYFYTFPDKQSWEQFYIDNEAALMSSPDIVTTKRITRLAFMQRFTQQERLAIRQAAKQNPEVEDYLAMLDAATFVDLNREDTAASLAALAQAGLLTETRTSEIITAPVQPAEAYT